MKYADESKAAAETLVNHYVNATLDTLARIPALLTQLFVYWYRRTMTNDIVSIAQDGTSQDCDKLY